MTPNEGRKKALALGADTVRIEVGEDGQIERMVAFKGKDKVFSIPDGYSPDLFKVHDESKWFGITKRGDTDLNSWRFEI